MDWAFQQVRAGKALISGFQSPLERSVLELALVARSPVVIVTTRNLLSTLLPTPWRLGLEAGHVALISMEQTRVTEEAALRRNLWVADHARHIVVGYAQPGGLLASQVDAWRQEGRLLRQLHPTESEAQS
jgi:hypothetical protein